MRLGPECLEAGSFEVYQERARETCGRCGGDGEIPDCPRCGDAMVWYHDQQHFGCLCEEGDE